MEAVHGMLMPQNACTRSRLSDTMYPPGPGVYEGIRQHVEGVSIVIAGSGG